MSRCGSFRESAYTDPVRTYYIEAVERIPDVVLSKCRRHGAVALSLITLLILIINPVPLCFACEFPDPWGHKSGSGDTAVLVWMAVAPFLAGLLAVKKGWLVPILSVIAFIATQPLGGVPALSLRSNEGPFIVIFGLPASAACFGAGHLARGIVFFTKRIISPNLVDPPSN